MNIFFTNFTFSLSYKSVCNIISWCSITLKASFFLPILKKCSPAGHSALQEVHHLLCMLLGAVVEIDTLYKRRPTQSNTLRRQINHRCFTGHGCCTVCMHANTHTHRKVDENMAARCFNLHKAFKSCSDTEMI